MLDFTPAQTRAYEAKMDRAARRAAYRAEKARELSGQFLAAALGPDAGALVPTPGLPIAARPISELLADEIDSAELHGFLRDAAQGADVSVQASLLLSVLSVKFGGNQADFALEEAEAAGEVDDTGPDPDEAYDRWRDDQRDEARQA